MKRIVCECERCGLEFETDKFRLSANLPIIYPACTREFMDHRAYMIWVLKQMAEEIDECPQNEQKRPLARLKLILSVLGWGDQDFVQYQANKTAPSCVVISRPLAVFFFLIVFPSGV